MIGFLTSIVGIVAKGRAAKAMAGGAAGLILNAGGPILDALADGFATGAIPEVEKLGVVLGQAAAGYAVGWVITWVSPANKPKTD